MIVKPNLAPKGRGSAVESLTLDKVSDAEARVLFFALEEYKKNLMQTIEASREEHYNSGAWDFLEDEVFGYAEIAKCSQLQWLLKDNFDQPLRKKVGQWLDI